MLLATLARTVDAVVGALDGGDLVAAKAAAAALVAFVERLEAKDSGSVDRGEAKARNGRR